ncbi:MAG: ABC transporter ATP-binding protein [Clostridiaceae bacterium]|nr:ABC transporter ATP-binding protein [Clostridiaceae bacterium]
MGKLKKRHDTEGLKDIENKDKDALEKASKNNTDEDAKEDKDEPGSILPFGEILKRFVILVKPYWVWILISLVMSVIAAQAEVNQADFVKKILNGALGGHYNEMISNLLNMAGFILITVVGTFLVRYSLGRLGTFAMYDLRKKIVHHIKKIRVSEMEKNHTGDLVSRMTSDASIVQGFLQEDMFVLFYQPVLFVGALIGLIMINWKMFLLSLVFTGAASILTLVVMAPLGIYSGKLQKGIGDMLAAAQDTIGGIQIIKAFNLTKPVIKKIEGFVNFVLKITLKMEVMMGFIMPLMFAIQLLPLAATVMIGGYLTVRGEITLPELVKYVYLLSLFTDSASEISGLFSKLAGVSGAGGRMFEILDYITEREDGGSFDEETKAPVIEIDNITFKYDESLDTTTLRGMTFSLSKGSVTALVGASGCGKSTVLKLLTGFYEASEGEIRVYGEDICKWNLNKLRSKIALVSQDTFLFPGSVAENIAYGRVEATMGEIIKAAKTANIHDFIMTLPEGYNTQVGERGSKLSGGQKQRISIARAILKDAPILLLDEATSALDTESEALVQEALEKFMVGRTVLVIAHRFSTIKNAGRIIVIDEGKVVESGSHDELMSINGMYSQLYTRQFAS